MVSSPFHCFSKLLSKQKPESQGVLSMGSSKLGQSTDVVNSDIHPLSIKKDGSRSTNSLHVLASTVLNQGNSGISKKARKSRLPPDRKDQKKAMKNPLMALVAGLVTIALTLTLGIGISPSAGLDKDGLDAGNLMNRATIAFVVFLYFLKNSLISLCLVIFIKLISSTPFPLLLKKLLISVFSSAGMIYVMATFMNTPNLEPGTWVLQILYVLTFLLFLWLIPNDLCKRWEGETKKNNGTTDSSNVQTDNEFQVTNSDAALAAEHCIEIHSASPALKPP